MKKKTKQILAVIGIALLLAMYIVNIVLAVIGTEWSRNLLKGTMVLSLMIPILLYAFLMIMKKTSGKNPEDEFTPEEWEKIRKKMEESEDSEN